MALLIVTPLGVAAARQLGPTAGSPATGRAQVVTQGIATLPSEEVVWRVVERTAPPRAEARPLRTVLGFVLASDEPILLTNQTDAGPEDVARLAPGEAYLVKAGVRQTRASLLDRPVTYLAIELVPADRADRVGSARLLFTSSPFTPPPGQRDLDLVRNVIPVGEQAFVPDTGEATVVLATDGAIEILPAGGRARTLEAGESAIVEPGELVIEAVAPSGRAAKLPIAALTSSLTQQSAAVAAYVVAVIGPEIPPPPTPTTTAPVPTAAPPTPTSTPEPVGSIAVTVWDCPPGMSVQNLVPEQCRLSAGGFDVILFAADGSARSLADAALVGTAYVWSDLPFGQYALLVSPLPPGYDSYFIPGSAAVGGAPETGYTVTIDAVAPDIALNVYNVQAIRTGTITVLVYDCPPNAVPDNYAPTDCPPSPGGYDFTLLGSAMTPRSRSPTRQCSAVGSPGVACRLAATS